MRSRTAGRWPTVHAGTAVMAGVLSTFAAPPAMPQATAPAAEQRAEFQTQLVRPGLYVVAGAGTNVAVWTGADGTVLVDDGLATLAPPLLETVGRIADGPLRLVVNTHWHPDHAGGNELAARSGAIVVAHERARASMGTAHVSDEYGVRIPASPHAALPVVTFPDELALDFNGDRLVVSHADAAHTGGDAIVWWDNANVVHLGDVYCNGSYPFVDLANGGSLAGMVAAIEGVLSRADADTVVIPGHGPLSGREELVAYRDMLVAAGRRVRELVEQGGNLEQVLAARPTQALDDRWGKGPVTPERFVRVLYEDLAARR